MADRARRCDERDGITWDEQNHVRCETHVRAHNECMSVAEEVGFDEMHPYQCSLVCSDNTGGDIVLKASPSSSFRLSPVERRRNLRGGNFDCHGLYDA